MDCTHHPRPTSPLWVWAVIFTIALMSFAVVTGCDSNPRQDFATVQDTYIGAQQVLISARASGEIDDEDWAEIVPLMETLHDLLGEYNDRSQSDQPVESIAAEVRQVLSELRPHIVRYSD